MKKLYRKILFSFLIFVFLVPMIGTSLHKHEDEFHCSASSCQQHWHNQHHKCYIYELNPFANFFDFSENLKISYSVQEIKILYFSFYSSHEQVFFSKQSRSPPKFDTNFSL